MKIGLVAMSAKPYHAGHDGLVRKAAAENDKVMLYVSTSDRKTDAGGIKILGSDMAEIWKRYIAPTLPGNVVVDYGGSPVRKIYEYLGKANETSSKNTFTVYSDPEDLATNFPEKNMVKYLGNLWSNKQVSLVPVERTSTVNVSGTKMRQYLQTGDKKNFIKNLPSGVDGEAIWNILNAHKNESLLRSYVRLVLS